MEVSGKMRSKTIVKCCCKYSRILNVTSVSKVLIHTMSAGDPSGGISWDYNSQVDPKMVNLCKMAGYYLNLKGADQT